MALLSTGGPADEAAVRDLTARFSDAVNRRDPAALGALFVAEGRWEVPGLPETVGPVAIEAAFAALAAELPFLVQLLHSGTVELDGDRATGRWYLSEHARDPDGGGSLFVGAYEDEAVRTADGWRFASRRFQFLYRGRDELPGRAYPYAGREAAGR